MKKTFYYIVLLMLGIGWETLQAQETSAQNTQDFDELAKKLRSRMNEGKEMKDKPGGFSGGIAVLGIPIGQTKLAEMILKIKSLRPGSDTPEDIIRQIGATDHVTKQGNREEWLYKFIVPPDDREYELMGGRAFDTGVQCIITFGEDGKASSVKVKKIHDGHEEILYAKGDEVAPASQNPSSQGLMPHLTEAPATPQSGQIYFNEADKHFYGWDGTSWLKMDTKP